MIINTIIDDLKETWDTLKAIVEGKAKLRHNPDTILGTLDNWFKENWYLLLIFIGFTVAGYYLGYTKAGAECMQMVQNMSTSDTPRFIVQNITFLNYT